MQKHNFSYWELENIEKKETKKEDKSIFNRIKQILKNKSKKANTNKDENNIESPKENIIELSKVKYIADKVQIEQKEEVDSFNEKLKNLYEPPTCNAVEDNTKSNEKSDRKEHKQQEGLSKQENLQNTNKIEQKNQFNISILPLKKLLNKINKHYSISDGYVINHNSTDKIPDSLITMLIDRFLNNTFCSNNSTLNQRSNNMEITYGYDKWDVTKLVKDIVTKNLNQVPNDKYGYKYERGNDETIPLSFYFDLSGSMEDYSHLLSLIAVELIKNNVKVLVGFNDKVTLQIEKVPTKFNVSDFKKIFNGRFHDAELKSIEYSTINKSIDEYLIDKQAEKTVIFSDYDALQSIIQLSKKCEVYWFSFETRYSIEENLNDFKGKYFITQTKKDIVEHLKNIDNRVYEMKQRESIFKY